MDNTHALIIDGDKGSAKKLGNLLDKNGYKADLCHSTDDALNQMGHFPDIVIINSANSAINALNLCQEVRCNKRHKHISIIIMSEKQNSKDNVACLKAGADDCVITPVDDEELLARIEAVLRRNHVFSENQEERGVLVTELKHILSEELIVPFFQPIYSMESHLAFGVEALNRPQTNGLIDNAEFLFKTALILDMYSEIEMLCWKKSVSQWKDDVNREKLFLNCTPYFIESGRLNEEFLLNLNVDLKSIILEITERTAIQKHDLFIQELNSLRSKGIGIAVDDVGSGFASLDTVVEIRPDIVKIDRHLVRNLHKDELRYNIIHTVISFCKKSKIMTIAEGIETEEELDAVSELGVDAIQGFLVGKPAQNTNIDIFEKKFDY